MKVRKILVAIILLAMAHVAQAKDIKVVIKGHPTSPIGSTEVFVGKDIGADTITVVPGKNATFLTISLKGLDGETFSSDVLPVGDSGSFNIITPAPPEGFLLEVKDNNGVVYTGVENED